MKTLIVSHDAGGANCLAYWLKNTKDIAQCDFLLAGPAENIFLDVLGPITLRSTSSAEALLYRRRYQKIFVSCSAAEFEKRILSIGIGLGVDSAVMIDHWSNYEKRLQFQGEWLVPNIILVNDEYAQAKVSDVLSDNGLSSMVRRVENYYLNSLVEEIRQPSNSGYRKGSNLRLLFVCEPSTSMYYTDIEVLKLFIQYISGSKQTLGAVGSVRVRLHPSEEKGKYDPIVEQGVQAGLEIEYSQNSSFVEDCAWSDVVVGCETMAMVVALHAGKKVYSAMPACQSSILLPQVDIKRLFKPIDMRFA
jgi:hypothetical protein